MIYRNDDRGALRAMELARTGYYGDYESGGNTFACPCCGAAEPDVFYVNDEEECVGCSECVYASDRPW